LSHSCGKVTPTRMKRTRLLGTLGMLGLIIAMSCSSEVTALSGCPEGSKQCSVDGVLTCVDVANPDYGCNAPPTVTHQCFSCGTLGFAHGTPSCNAVSGQCAVAACDPGFLFCDADQSHGCNTSISTDNGNCGACHVRCEPGAHQATSTCQAGRCVATCEAGYVSCAPGMVCECGPNQACVNKVCT
jgi:hypothetical protein